MKIGKAVSAGILGALTMTVIAVLLRFLGLTSMNLEMALGSMVTLNISALTWIIGLGMHLVAGAVFAVIYALAFRSVYQANGWVGLSFGFVHALFSGILVMGLMPAVHPLIPDVLAAPGMFAINYGAFTAVVFFALHLIYGAIVGSSYGRAKRSIGTVDFQRDIEHRKAA